MSPKRQLQSKKTGGIISGRGKKTEDLAEMVKRQYSSFSTPDLVRIVLSLHR